jgi:EmrB/QacA subfamily drug resistance transporter
MTSAPLAPSRDVRILKRTLVVLILGTLMSSVDATVTNVALHSLSHDLHADVADTQWVISAYLLALAAVIPASGWLARRFAPRNLYTASLALFALSSGLCAAANTLPALVGFRVLQGLAGGLLMPVSQLIAAEVAGPRRMGRTISRIWIASSLGGIIGPTLGGVILQSLGWRWIFLINVPIGLVATIMSFRLLPETQKHPVGRLDFTGLLRLTIGVPLLVYALTQAEIGGTQALSRVLVPLVVSLLLLIDFFRHARRLKEPLIDLRLFRRRVFATAVVCLFWVNVAWSSTLILLPLYLQQARHLSPALAGLLLAPQGLGTLISIWGAGRVKNVHRGATIAVLGAIAFAGTTTLFGSLGPGDPAWLVAVVLLAAGLVGGQAWVAATAASYVDLSPTEISHASPIVTSMARLGQAFGAAFGAVVLQVELHAHAGAGSGGALPRAAHVTSAYHASFHWTACAALISGLMFWALRRSTASRSTRSDDVGHVKDRRRSSISHMGRSRRAVHENPTMPVALRDGTGQKPAAAKAQHNVRGIEGPAGLEDGAASAAADGPVS